MPAPMVESVQSGYDVPGLHQVLSGAAPGQVWACTAHLDILRCPIEWHADSAAALVTRAQACAEQRQRTAEGLVVPFVVVLDVELISDEIADGLDALREHPALSLVLMET
jgi:hypothetical protein